MNVQLTDEERELLLAVLQGRMTELRGEIHHARVKEFKEELLRREQLLRDLLEKLQADS
jgi:hypothetical protein